MENMPVLLLFIYSAFTVNLLLQCALGIKAAVDPKKLTDNKSDIGSPLDKITLIKSGIIFFSVIILWFIFSKVLFSIIKGVYIYVLLFPVSFIVYEAFEYLLFTYVIKKKIEDERQNNFYGGITAVSVFICVYIANNFLETLALALGFTFGIFFIKLILREIQKRAALEAVPVFLRGKPLVLITMGMLSLIFTTASVLLFRMIGVR